jgi:UDP-N-acetylmuramate dehydrogenase
MLGNAGSFFTNPLVSLDTYAELKSRHPGLVGFGHGTDDVKLAAAWLVDYCGWKGYREGDIGVSERQALVLVNHGGGKGRDLVTLSERIRDSVYATFAIRLQTEPVIL